MDGKLVWWRTDGKYLQKRNVRDSGKLLPGRPNARARRHNCLLSGGGVCSQEHFQAIWQIRAGWRTHVNEGREKEICQTHVFEKANNNVEKKNVLMNKGGALRVSDTQSLAATIFRPVTTL